MIQRKNPQANGMATAFVLVVLFVLTVLGFAFGSRGTVALNQVYISRQYMLAYYAAQAGIMTAIEAEQQNDVQLPALCGQIKSSDATLPSGATRLPSLQTLTLPYTLANNASFSITMTNNSAIGGCVSNATAPDGTLVPSGSVYITSKGTAQGKTKISNVMVPVTPGSGNPPVYFNYAAFAQTAISLATGASTDSYNSASGAYGGSNKGSKGNIGTNSKTNAIVTLSGGSTVKGEVDVGSGGSPGPPTISAVGGSTYSKAVVLSTAVGFPGVIDPVTGAPGSTNVTCNAGGCTPALNANTAYGNISFSSANVSLGCGNYSMTSFSMSSGSTLTISCTSGAVKFYVHGGSSITNPINLSTGAVVNSAGSVQVPSTFQIYDLSSATGCTGGARCTDVISTATGNPFDLVLYAPNSAITVSNGGAIFGSLTGYTISNSNGAAIHYDQALSNVQIGTAGTPRVVGNFTIWNFQ